MGRIYLGRGFGREAVGEMAGDVTVCSGMDFGRKIIREADPPQVLLSGAVPLLLLR